MIQKKEVTVDKREEALLVVDEIKEDQSRVQSIFDDTGEVKLTDDAEEAESKETVTEEKDVSVHEVEISVASIPFEERVEEAVSK